MPAKDACLRKIVSDKIGSTRKGRNKVIKLVQKDHPGLGCSRIRRVYERYGFALHRRLKRRVAHNPSNPISLPLQPNEEWGIDFMSDALVNGKKIRTLNIIDHFNRFCGITISSN